MSDDPTSGMSPDQVYAFNLLKGGGHIHLDGPAGTGKSFLLNAWARSLPVRERPLRAASTSSAAKLIGGKTVNSLFGLPPEVHIPGSIASQPLSDIPENMHFHFKVLANASSILVDEISMTRIDTFQAMLERLKQVKTFFRTKPGIPRLILVGDFAQLTPVISPQEEDVMRHYYHDRVFAFEHAFWSAVQPVSLCTVHRQKDDLTFANWLNEIREGRVPDLKWINNYVREPREGAVSLVTRRDKAREINAREMEKLPGNPVTMRGSNNSGGPEKEKDQPVPTELKLKIGARVIVCANQQGVNAQGQKDYVNGSTGVFVGLGRDRNGKAAARVMLDEGKEVLVSSHTWKTVSYEKVRDPGGDVSDYRMVAGNSFSQIPLLPGWAITVHRSQGMSLKQAHVDVKGTFAAGQVYVALSRLTSTEGLSLSSPVGYNDIIQSRRVREYNARLAQEARTRLEAAEADEAKRDEYLVPEAN